MSDSRLQIKVPGKLLIAGEYAVTEPGQPSIVVAVDRYITAAIESSDKNEINLPQWEMEKLSWEEADHQFLWNSHPKLAFIRAAITIWHQFLQEQKRMPIPFRLTITSELDDPSGRKYGLGSSAAVVVAVITAFWHFYRFDLDRSFKRRIFKLAAIAHYQTQGNGSCADIAAAAFGHWLSYSTFDSDWLMGKIRSIPITKLIDETWPGLFIQEVSPPTSLQLCVGWTGRTAATGPMVQKVHQLKDTHPIFYQDFLQQSRDAVTRLLKSFEANDGKGAIAALRENREALMRLDEQAAAGIETKEIKALIEVAEKYGSGKSSGAGGGDCGIAFVEGEQAARELRKKWQEKQLLPLSLQVSPEGAHLFLQDRKV
ncbi:phosphomevalonate kinase [Lederbergia sp. NSJ-179]|uniref:phosphomevalonate kinase n=1 Tax=Lederbergia sp. NSJ-179 TaxID=2931402 RepID=UPI001FD616C0|nr:phosphomevalonate kinase [Lederbergia sp. NSJ-179]MCJ7840110.1 phosphomevalonate kinase [Lederbergia sp. NSJ-179]